VSGLAGTGAGIGVLISTYLIGRVTDRFSFQPVIVAGVDRALRRDYVLCVAGASAQAAGSQGHSAQLLARGVSGSLHFALAGLRQP